MRAFLTFNRNWGMIWSREARIRSERSLALVARPSLLLGRVVVHCQPSRTHVRHGLSLLHVLWILWHLSQACVLLVSLFSFTNRVQASRRDVTHSASSFSIQRILSLVARIRRIRWIPPMQRRMRCCKLIQGSKERIHCSCEVKFMQ